MQLDTVNVSKALGKQLLGFFNKFWGGPESAADDLLGGPSFSKQPVGNLTDVEASRMLRAFIENYDVIAARAGWRSQSLLACAIAAEAWIDHLGSQEEETFALLGVRRLLDATGAIAGTDDLAVITMDAEVDSRLQDLGVVEAV